MITSKLLLIYLNRNYTDHGSVPNSFMKRNVSLLQFFVRCSLVVPDIRQKQGEKNPTSIFDKKTEFSHRILKVSFYSLNFTFTSPLKGYISAVSQSILNFQKKPERSLNFLQDDANRDLLSLFVQKLSGKTQKQYFCLELKMFLICTNSYDVVILFWFLSSS